MEDTIRRAIERQAKKLLEREKRSRYAQVKYQRRYKLRTGEAPAPAIYRDPLLWEMAPHFDPKHCISHSKYLAKTVWTKILLRDNDVKPAILYKIPKDSGGHREIMVFSIVDAAIANVFNRKLRDRNRNILSSFLYSYRQDRGLFDAVLQLSSYLTDEKTYIIQFDFSKYFDSIKHDYIKFLLENDIFVISPTEKFLIDKFLCHRYANQQDYKLEKFQSRHLGVPQGCSLSLFLSNIAAHELDKELERMNGMFVRFADDIVCVTHNHDDALAIVDRFREHCKHSGISINYEKSPGIQQLRPKAESEKRIAFSNLGDIGRIKSTEEFDYIGHKFRSNDILMSSRAVGRVKKRISRIIYVHLLHAPKSKGKFSPDRVGKDFYDWDLVTCVNELKKYIYGGLTEQRLRDFLIKNTRIRRFKGLMSFYPLVSSVEQFAELDGWLLSVLRRALSERRKILKDKFRLQVPPVNQKTIKDGSWYNYTGGISLETNAPSFVLAWRAARKSFKQYGLSDFDQPSYYSILSFGPPTYDAD